MAEAKRCDLEVAIRENVSQVVADSLALDVLPKQSLQALGDLLGVEEKTGHLERVKTLLEDFATDLTAVMQREGQYEAVKYWNQTWPVVDANLCAVIEPLPDGELRAELEAYYFYFQDRMGEELQGTSAEPGDEKSDPDES